MPPSIRGISLRNSEFSDFSFRNWYSRSPGIGTLDLRHSAAPSRFDSISVILSSSDVIFVVSDAGLRSRDLRLLFLTIARQDFELLILVLPSLEYAGLRSPDLRHPVLVTASLIRPPAAQAEPVVRPWTSWLAPQGIGIRPCALPPLIASWPSAVASR